MTGAMAGPIERVVVPLDAASDNRNAIDTAARLALRWKVRLHGVFVEDEDLLRLARLPFAHVVSLGRGIERLTAEHAEGQLRVFADAAQRDLAAAARRYGVEWSFEVLHGQPEVEPFAASGRDFLVAATITRPIGAHYRVECRWWHTVETVSASCLLVRGEWGTAGPVVIRVHDRAEGSARALDVAARCAEAAGGLLAVMCAPELAESAGFNEWLAERLAPYAARAQIELMPGDAASLLRRCVELECQLLVLEPDSAQPQSERLREMAAGISCDFLVVR